MERGHRRLLVRGAEAVRRSGTPVLVFEPDAHTLYLIGDEPLDPARNREIVAATRKAVDTRLATDDDAARRARRLFDEAPVPR